MVGAAGDHRRAGGKPGRGGGLGGDLADHLVRASDFGGKAAGSMWPSATRSSARDCRSARSMKPASSAQLCSTAPDAGEPPVDVVVGAEDGARCGAKHLGLVALQPAQLGRDELLVDAVAGLGARRRRGRTRRRARRPRGRCAPSLCWMLRRSRSPSLVEQHDGRQHAGDADRGDVAAPAARRLQQLAGHGAGVRPTTARVLLGPARHGRSEGRSGARRAPATCRQSRSGCRSSRWCRCRCRGSAPSPQRSSLTAP